MRREGGGGRKGKSQAGKTRRFVSCVGDKGVAILWWMVKAFTVGIKWAVRWEAYGGRHVVSFK